MDRFVNNEVNEFYFTLNYLGEMIKVYFNSINHELKIHYKISYSVIDFKEHDIVT